MVVHYHFKHRQKTADWDCNVPLSCFKVPKKELKRLQEAGITTIEKLLNPPEELSLETILSGSKNAAQIQSLINEFKIRFVKNNHHEKLRVLRNNNCRYTKQELSVFIIFHMLLPLIKKHCIDIACASVPETILNNELKLRVLLAA